MADSDQQMNTNSGLSVNTTLQITIAIVILNIVLFVIIILLYVRAKGYVRTLSSSRSRRLIFAAHEPNIPRHALDPTILNSLPITVFKSEDFEEDGGLECAVCLCELTDGEEARLLPKCKHGFHVDCIDMWFHSNSTCPLCRNPVSIESSSVEIGNQPLEAISETGNSPNEESSRLAGPSSSTASSSLGKGKVGMWAIDIPRRMTNGFSSLNTPLSLSRLSPISPLPTSRMAGEGIRSPALGRMKSLRRMLSRGKGTGASCSPRGCDVEQGGISSSKYQ